MKKTDQIKLKNEYQEIVCTIQHLLNEWDPYDLLKGGAPESEFTEEATLITAKIKNSETPTELAHIISDIFSKNFETDQFPAEACLPIASRIFRELKARSLLQ